MNKTHRMNRFASFGLAAVFLMLASYSVYTSIITLEVIAQVRETRHMGALYQQAHYAVSTEDLLLQQYYINPSSSTWAEYQAAAANLNTILRSIRHDGDGKDRAFVTRITPDQEQFQHLTLLMFTAITTHQMVHAKAIYNVAIDKVYDTLAVQSNDAASADRALTTASLEKLDRTQSTIIVSTSVVFVLSLLLLVLFWRMLQSFQRKLDQAAHAQLVQMEHTALTDPLTNLPNHRAIINQIDVELLRCSTTQRNCAIIFVDVDHFKRINDTWGHAAGDIALCTVGQRLREGLRAEDYVGRYGGEEFAILLADIEQQEAVEVAERLRCSIAGQPYEWKHEETEHGVQIPLTASFGLAFYPLDGITGKDLIEMADAAMYHAKHSGRNRVCLPDDVNSALLNASTNEQHTENRVIQVLSRAAALHDQDTYGHGLRLQDLAEATAHMMGRSAEDGLLIRLAAQLHDIGKIGIPETILHKPGPLTSEEWTVMRSHPRMSHEILAQAGGRFNLVSHIVVAHHERWDGEGYPYGLTREEIPLGARILAVVDTFDAMTSSRPYREALPQEKACAELQRCAGTQFDPQVVEAFLQVLREQDPIHVNALPATI